MNFYGLLISMRSEGGFEVKHDEICMGVPR